MKNKFVMSIVLSAMMSLTFGCGETTPPPVTPAEPPEEVKFYTPDPEKGYTDDMSLRYTIADFQYGTEIPYNRYLNSNEKEAWHAKSFTDFKPAYSYSPDVADPTELNYQSTSTWVTPAGENSNYFVVYPETGGTHNGTVDADYRLYIPLDDLSSRWEYTSYLHWDEAKFEAAKAYESSLNLSLYDELYFKVKATRSHSNARTSMTFFMKDRKSGKIHELTTANLANKTVTVVKADLWEIDEAERETIEWIRFRVNVDLEDGQTDRIDLYSIEALSTETIEGNDFDIDDMIISSEYLGNMFASKWGAYSASGFYDSTDKKWKLWFGAGIPEATSSDNVYYTECEDLSKPWSKPVRVNLEHFGILYDMAAGPGYGGDPSVIKVDGTYYMYFSGLQKGLHDGTYDHWNKVFLATSQDGINWTLHKTPVVDAQTGGGMGYGAGGPSAVYTEEGKFRVYYYTQTPEETIDGPMMAGLMMKESNDGYNFGLAKCIKNDMGAGDVKYIPSLKKWAMVYETAERTDVEFDQEETVRIALSDDGINWEFNEIREIAQNDFIPSCHNPGFIGTERGFGFETMFVTYGANDLPLSFQDGTQYDSRQIEWSRVTIS